LQPSPRTTKTIGKLVGEAIDKVGGEGVVTVEEAKGTETAVEVVQGLQFDRGYLSPYFVTDPERMECVLQDPLVLIHDKRIGVMKDMLPVLEQAAKEGRTLLIMTGSSHRTRGCVGKRDIAAFTAFCKRTWLGFIGSISVRAAPCQI
jgi:chaperonin GroEL (HSP60 family)